eukprot:GDKJ01020183.1.p1 GENE.GDKJ01020183.1~~GDKJ01020183.1.p1  ORF type:complete len:297 (-),score=53.95 GDKJ01020183.1:121-1011(-)
MAKLRPIVKLFFDKATSTAQYVVACPQTKKCAIIDPVRGFDRVTFKTNLSEFSSISKFIKENEFSPVLALETHIHADHLTGVDEFKSQYAAGVGIGEGVKVVQNVFSPFYSTREDALPPLHQPFDYFYKDGERFNIGNLECEVLHTPGHTPACVTYNIGDSIFTGDTIFMPDSGTARCDFPGGSAETLYSSIKKLYGNFPDETRVFVGHDYQPGGREIMTETTIDALKKHNTHLTNQTSKEEFVKKRTDRDATLSLPQLLHFAIPVNLRGGVSNFSKPARLTIPFDVNVSTSLINQ